MTAMMYEQLRYQVEQSVATITLNRPARLNAWTPQMGVEMKRAFGAAERDPDVIAIVLTGEGRGFCAGADMSTLAGLSQGPAADGTADGAEADPGDASMGPSFRGPFSYPMSILKPVIGAINGPCVGLGLAIALSCDLRFAASTATFSTAFARLGLIAEWGTSWMLPRLVGTANALDLLLSARTVSADEARHLGLVNRVAPPEELLHEAQKYARELATHCSPTSLSVIKRDVHRHLTTNLEEAERDALSHMHESFVRPDFREALASRMEKRPPRFLRPGKHS